MGEYLIFIYNYNTLRKRLIKVKNKVQDQYWIHFGDVSKKKLSVPTFIIGIGLYFFNLVIISK